MSQVNGKAKNGRRTLKSIEQLFEYGLDLKTRTVFLGSSYDEAGKEIGIDNRVTETLIKNLHLLREKRGNIRLVLNSPGGYVESGIAIYDAIRTFPYNTDIEVCGEASSMASVILQAGRRRLLHQNAVVMIHDGTVGTDGEQSTIDRISQAKFMEYELQRMYDIYASRSSLTSEEWREKCRHDTYLTAKEAVDLGLADEIIRPKHAFSKQSKKK